MLIGMYAIFDVKAEIYTIPFFLHHDAPAIRAFKNMINDKEHQFSKNPEDYSLAKLGMFDDNTGELLGDYIKLIEGMEASQGTI